jgi:NhaP-type Na+/H+ or K+/H+ antiporter
VPEVRFVSGVLIAVGLLLALARLLKLPQSAVLFVGGLASTLLPGLLPAVHVDPEVVLGLLLPPLLYAGTAALSVDLLRHAFGRGVLGGAVLVIGITVLVTEATRLLLLGLDPTAYLLVGIAVSIGDTRLAQETGQDEQLPRVLTDAFAGQGVSARLIVVTLYLLARNSIGGPPPGPAEILLRLGTDLAGGGAIGFAVGLAAAEFRRRIGPATVEVAVSVATPFLAAALAEAAGVSVAVVIVAAALTVSWRAVDRQTGEAISSSEARLVSRHFWLEVGVLLSGGLFFLMGRALPEALAGLGRFGWQRLALRLCGKGCAALTRGSSPDLRTPMWIIAAAGATSNSSGCLRSRITRSSLNRVVLTRRAAPSGRDLMNCCSMPSLKPTWQRMILLPSTGGNATYPHRRTSQRNPSVAQPGDESQITGRLLCRCATAA